MVKVFNLETIGYEIENCSGFSIIPPPGPLFVSSPSHDIIKRNSELKKLNDILEREINLLKSLILINNLNLNTTESKSRKNFYIFHLVYNENYIVEMSSENNLKQVINDDRLFKTQEIFHIMQLKINVK